MYEFLLLMCERLFYYATVGRDATKNLGSAKMSKSVLAALAIFIASGAQAAADTVTIYTVGPDVCPTSCSPAHVVRTRYAQVVRQVEETKLRRKTGKPAGSVRATEVSDITLIREGGGFAFSFSTATGADQQYAKVCTAKAFVTVHPKRWVFADHSDQTAVINAVRAGVGDTGAVRSKRRFAALELYLAIHVSTGFCVDHPGETYAASSKKILQDIFGVGDAGAAQKFVN